MRYFCVRLSRNSFCKRQNLRNWWNMHLYIILWWIRFRWKTISRYITIINDVIMSNHFKFMKKFVFEIIYWLTSLHWNFIIVAWKFVLIELFDYKTTKNSLICSFRCDLLIFLITCFSFFWRFDSFFFLIIESFDWLYSFRFSIFRLWFFKHFWDCILRRPKYLSTSHIFCLWIVRRCLKKRCLWNHLNNDVRFNVIMFSWFNVTFRRRDWKETKLSSNRRITFFFCKKSFFIQISTIIDYAESSKYFEKHFWCFSSWLNNRIRRWKWNPKFFEIWRILIF